MSLAARIKQTIEKSGLTQREFAKKAGVTESQLSRWLSGENEPQRGSLQKIARTGNQDFQWLATGETLTRLSPLPAEPSPLDELDRKLAALNQSVQYARTLKEQGLLDDETRSNIVNTTEKLIRQIDRLLASDPSSSDPS